MAIRLLSGLWLFALSWRPFISRGDVGLLHCQSRVVRIARRTPELIHALICGTMGVRASVRCFIKLASRGPKSLNEP